jgi:Low iron-inducible periplasmic protein
MEKIQAYVRSSLIALYKHEAAVNKALVTMHLMAYTIRELEESVQQCKNKCALEGCTELGIHAVDSAAAFYFGSLDNGNEGSGRLMQSVADLECKEFKTCGSTGDSLKGRSKATYEVLQELQIMQHNITQRACTDARSRKDQIVRWMKVPLIQGTIRYAYLRYQNKATSVDIATGAIYAASIVPLVSGCSFTDAAIINNNMETTARATDFAAVKSAFERQYTCLGVKCSDIGGYWDQSNKAYYDAAEMCNFDVVQDASAPEDKKNIQWGIIASLAVLLVLSLYLYQRRRKAQSKQKKNKARESDIDFSDSSDDSDGDFRIT